MYFCTRPSLMLYLKDRGFEAIDTLPNKYKPEFLVWRFVKTPELMAAVDAFYAELK